MENAQPQQRNQWKRRGPHAPQHVPRAPVFIPGHFPRASTSRRARKSRKKQEFWPKCRNFLPKKMGRFSSKKKAGGRPASLINMLSLCLKNLSLAIASFQLLFFEPEPPPPAHTKPGSARTQCNSVVLESHIRDTGSSLLRLLSPHMYVLLCALDTGILTGMSTAFWNIIHVARQAQVVCVGVLRQQCHSETWIMLRHKSTGSLKILHCEFKNHCLYVLCSEHIILGSNKDRTFFLVPIWVSCTRRDSRVHPQIGLMCFWTLTCTGLCHTHWTGRFSPLHVCCKSTKCCVTWNFEFWPVWVWPRIPLLPAKPFPTRSVSGQHPFFSTLACKEKNTRTKIQL